MTKQALYAIEKKLFSLSPALFLITSYTLIMVEKESRMYWPYIIGSYIIGAAVYYSHKALQKKSLMGYLFPKEVWFHQSSINDYTLFIFNYIFYFHFIALLTSEPTFVKDWLTLGLEYLNIPQNNETPGLIIAVIFTGFTLLLAELFYYLLHRAYHEVPFLWELHKVHHSAETMTPLTFIRAHPVDIFLQGILKTTSIFISSALFLYLYPNLEGMVMIASVDAGLFLYYIMGANLHHSHIWLSFGNKLEHIFISPAQHQIHHSNKPKHFDTNYGSMLAVWDWAFNSLYIPSEKEDITFGIGNEKEQKNYDSTLKMLIYPMKQMSLMLISPLRKKKNPTKINE